MSRASTVEEGSHVLVTMGGRLSRTSTSLTTAVDEQSPDVSRCSHSLRDVLQAGIVSVVSIAGSGLTAFAWLNVALTVGWLARHDTSLSNIKRGLYDSYGASSNQLVERLR
jgi:hypothetical protein